MGGQSGLRFSLRDFDTQLVRIFIQIHQFTFTPRTAYTWFYHPKLNLLNTDAEFSISTKVRRWCIKVIEIIYWMQCAQITLRPFVRITPFNSWKTRYGVFLWSQSLGYYHCRQCQFILNRFKRQPTAWNHHLNQWWQIGQTLLQIWFLWK